MSLLKEAVTGRVFDGELGNLTVDSCVEVGVTWTSTQELHGILGDITLERAVLLRLISSMCRDNSGLHGLGEFQNTEAKYTQPSTGA